MDLVYSVRCIGAFSYIDTILDNKTLLCFTPLPYHVAGMGDTIGIGIVYRYFGLRYQVSVSVSMVLERQC